MAYSQRFAQVAKGPGRLDPDSLLARGYGSGGTIQATDYGLTDVRNEVDVLAKRRVLNEYSWAKQREM